MKEKSTIGKVPIYSVNLELVLTDDIVKSQKKSPRFERLGKQRPLGAAGLMLWAGYDFCIMLDRRYLNHNVIAHECFHATHRIATYVGLKMRAGAHEEFAYLNGFLNNFVYNQLKEWNVRVK